MRIGPISIRHRQIRVAAVRLAVCTAAVSIGACATTNKGGSRAGTASSSDVERDARLLQMTDLRKLDTALVDDLLADRNPARRARAALAIGQVKGVARYARLRQLLVDPDTGVAANAAFALGIGKDSAAVVSLARAFAGAPDPVAIEAAWALGELGQSASAVLSIALGEGSARPLVSSTAAQRNPAVRAAVIVATNKLRTAPVAVLLPWLADSSAEVVRATAYVLARTRAPGGVRALASLRSSADEETRQHVARILAKGSAGDSLAARALEALNILITDTSARVRVNAVRSLATYGTSVRESVMQLLKDDDPNVRVATAEVLVPLLGTNEDVWKRAWAADSSIPVRSLVLSGARRYGIAAFQTHEDNWRQASDWRLRTAVLAARRTDTLHATRLPEVSWALTDPDVRVRSAGVSILRDVVADSAAAADSVRSLWWSMVTDADVQVRATALNLLRATASADRVPAVIAAYARAGADRDDDARLAALNFIASAWRRDSAQFTSAVQARLAALVPPRDSAERLAARAITPLASWKTAAMVPTAKPLSTYEALVRRYIAPSAKPVTAILHTERGDITLELSGRYAPLTVDNFVQLARRGFYRNTYFHRVVPNFVAQDGDPRGDGTGGPGYAIRDELNRQHHLRGCLAMALSGPDTGGSQYYMCHSPQPHLDGGYTVFGHITAGFDVLDRIVQTDRILSVEIR